MKKILKKVNSVLLIFSLIFCMAFPCYAEDDKNIKFYSKDMSTGEISEIYVDVDKEPVSTTGYQVPTISPYYYNPDMTTDDQIPIDNLSVFPYSTAVYIISRFPDAQNVYATGNLVGPSSVFTNANALYNRTNGQFAQTVTIYPRFVEGEVNTNVQTVMATSLVVNSAYMGNSANAWMYDYGMIRLNSNIGNELGYLGKTVLSDSQLLSKKVGMMAYALKKEENGITRRKLTRSYGNIIKLDSKIAVNDLDFVGYAGGALYARMEAGSLGFSMVGIMMPDSKSYAPVNSLAIRIDKTISNFIDANV